MTQPHQKGKEKSTDSQEDEGPSGSGGEENLDAADDVEEEDDLSGLGPDHLASMLNSEVSILHRILSTLFLSFFSLQSLEIPTQIDVHLRSLSKLNKGHQPPLLLVMMTTRSLSKKLLSAVPNFFPR